MIKDEWNKSLPDLSILSINIKENQNFKEFLFFPVMAIMFNAVNLIWNISAYHAIKLIDTNHVKGQTTFQPDPLKF